MLPGNVEAFDSASIHGQVKGYMSEWRKDIGAKVNQGDVLAVVDTPELDQSIAVAQSELAKAKANLALAKVTAARWISLRASAAVSQQAADEKDSDPRAKAAQVDAALSNVDRLKAQKAFANIVAPFDGVVTARNVDVGSLVKADSTTPALFTVADIHQMRIYVPVPESYAAELKDGMKARSKCPSTPIASSTRRSPRPRTRSIRNRARCWSSSSPTTRKGCSIRARSRASVSGFRLTPTLSPFRRARCCFATLSHGSRRLGLTIVSL